MNLAEAKAAGLAYKTGNRVGRGPGSGNGKTAGRGHKGAKARSGWSRRDGWEGGQMPLFRRLPKRGFNNSQFRKVYTVLNVRDLDQFEDGAIIDLEKTLELGLVSRIKGSDLFKILGDGEVTKKVSVKVHAITNTARAKIEAAGGTVELIETRSMREKFVRKDGSLHPKAVARAAKKNKA